MYTQNELVKIYASYYTASNSDSNEDRRIQMATKIQHNSLYIMLLVKLKDNILSENLKKSKTLGVSSSHITNVNVYLTVLK